MVQAAKALERVDPAAQAATRAQDRAPEIIREAGANLAQGFRTAALESHPRAEVLEAALAQELQAAAPGCVREPELGVRQPVAAVSAMAVGWQAPDRAALELAPKKEAALEAGKAREELAQEHRARAQGAALGPEREAGYPVAAQGLARGAVRRGHLRGASKVAELALGQLAAKALTRAQSRAAVFSSEGRVLDRPEAEGPSGEDPAAWVQAAQAAMARAERAGRATREADFRVGPRKTKISWAS